MNTLLEVLWVQGIRIGMKVNVKKTKLLKLGISAGGKVILDYDKIDQVGKFIQLGSIFSKDDGS